MNDTANPSMAKTGQSKAAPYLAIITVIIAVAMIEHLMGRSLMSSTGHVRFWVGDEHSAELSQQVADWYSFSHIIHGFAFYGLFYWMGKRQNWSFGWRMLMAVLVEAGWELMENSPIIIDRYRQTAAQGYVGDSILNSVCDVLCCVLGFVLSRSLPVWVTVALIIVMELGVGWKIHDNLALNIIMLIHPFAGIKRWQMGG